jgi:hypothetical protein
MWCLFKPGFSDFTIRIIVIHLFFYSCITMTFRVPRNRRSTERTISFPWHRNHRNRLSLPIFGFRTSVPFGTGTYFTVLGAVIPEIRDPPPYILFGRSAFVNRPRVLVFTLPCILLYAFFMFGIGMLYYRYKINTFATTERTNPIVIETIQALLMGDFRYQSTPTCTNPTRHANTKVNGANQGVNRET